MTSPRLTILLGSHREGRFGPTIGAWVAEHARGHGAFEVDVLDPADHDLPLQHPADRRAAAGAFLDRLDAADAVLLVGIVTYGGMSHGLRAAEALRPVLSALRAVAVTDTVGFAGPRDRFDADGRLAVDAAASEVALDRLLDDLARFTQLLAADAATSRPHAA